MTPTELMALAQTWVDLHGIPGHADDARDSLRAAIQNALEKARIEGAEDCCMAYDCERLKPQPEPVAQAEAVAWSDESAVRLAHRAGFAGTCWTMGPEELSYMLNMLGTHPHPEPVREALTDGERYKVLEIAEGMRTKARNNDYISRNSVFSFADELFAVLAAQAAKGRT